MKNFPGKTVAAALLVLPALAQAHHESGGTDVIQNLLLLSIALTIGVGVAILQPPR